MLLRNKDRERLLQLFSTVHIPMEVWAYGSRVNGTAHSGSDLDLVIRPKNKEKLPLKILTELRAKIQQSNIPIIVELFDWERLPESFHRNIETQHEVLYSNIEMTVNEPPAEYEKKPDEEAGK